MDNFLKNLDLQEKGIWLSLIVGTILVLFVLFMPKRQMNWRSIYLTIGVVCSVGLLLDINIIGQYFDLIDLGDPTKEGIGDLFSYAIIPPCLAVIYLNYFNQKKKGLYVVLFITLSFLYEWGLTQLGYMKLKGWQNWYSILVYIWVYGLWLPWHYNVLKVLNTDQNLQKEKPDVSGWMSAEPALKPINEQKEDKRNKN